MADQENFENDNTWNFDDDLGLSPEASKPIPKSAYEKAKAGIRGIGTGSLSALSNRATVTKIIDHTLPMGYGQGFKAASDVYDTARDIYSDASEEVGKVLDQTKEVVSKYGSTIDKVLPAKIASKIKGWSNTRRSQAQFIQEQSEESDIQNQLSDIFQATTEAQSEEESVKSALNRVRSEKREAANLSQLDSIRVGIEKLTNYQDRVLVNYQRKSLEIQLRQLQVSAKLLDVARDHSIRAVSALDTIKEEVTKPEIIRLQEHPLTRGTYGERGELERRQGLFGRGVNTLQRMRERMAQNAKQFVQDHTSNLLAGLQGISMAKDMQDQNAWMDQRDGYTKTGETIGGFLPSALAFRFGSRIRDRLNQNSTFRNIGNQLQYGTENIEQLIREEARSDSYQKDKDGNVVLDKEGNPKVSIRSRIAGYLKSVMGDDRGATAIDIDTVENIQTPTPFTRLNSRSLNTIIPGLLARIHQEVRMFRTGDESTPLINYDIESGEFTDMQSTSKRVIERLRDELGADNVRDRAFQIVDDIDQDRVLSEEDREQLAKKIIKDNYDKRLMSPNRLSDKDTFTDYFDEEKAHQIANIFQRYFSDDAFNDKRNQLSRNVAALSNDVAGSRLNFQDRFNVGQGSVLTDHGLVKEGRIDIDRLIDLFVNSQSDPKERDGAKGGFIGPLQPMGPYTPSSELDSLLSSIKGDIKSSSIKTKDSLKERFHEAKDSSINSFNKASDYIKENDHETILNDTKEVSRSFFNKSKEAINDKAKSITNKLSSKLTGLKSLFNKGKDKLDPYLESSQEKLNRLKDFTQPYLDRVLNNELPIPEGFTKEDILSHYEKIREGSKTKFFNLKEQLPEYVDKAKEKVAGVKGAAQEQMQKVSNVSLGNLASGVIMGSAQIARTAFMKPLRFMNLLGRRVGLPNMPNFGNLATGLSVNEALPVLLNYQLTQQLQGINRSVSNLVDETKKINYKPEAGSSEAIRAERKKKKEENMIDPKAAVKGGGLAAIGSLLGDLIGGGSGGGLGLGGSMAAGGLGAAVLGAAKKAVSKTWGIAKSAGAKAAGFLGLSKLFNLRGLFKGGLKGGAIGLGGSLATNALASQFEDPETQEMVQNTGEVLSWAAALAPFLPAGSMAAIGAGLLKAATVVGTILGSSVVIGGSVAAGAAYGGYKLFQYFTRDKYTLMNRIRMAQYGYDTEDEAILNKILTLESYIANFISFDDKFNPSFDRDSMRASEILNCLGIDPSDREATQRLIVWLEKRFLPVYSVHAGMLMKLKKEIILTKIEKLNDVEKLGFVKATRFESGPYSVMVNPLSDDSELNANADTVEYYYNKAVKELEKELSKKEKEGDKLQDIIKMGGSAADLSSESVTDAKQKIELVSDNKELGETLDLTEDSKERLNNRIPGSEALVVKSDSSLVYEETTTRINAIDALRFRVYGLTALEYDKVKALQFLEKAAIKDIQIDKEKGAQFKGNIHRLAQDYGEPFGVTARRNSLFKNWFTFRFLPVYVKTVAYVHQKTKTMLLSEGLLRLNPQALVDLGRSILQTTTLHKGGIHEVCKIIYSPWDNYELARDYNDAQLNLKALEDALNVTILAEEKKHSAGNNEGEASEDKPETDTPPKAQSQSAADQSTAPENKPDIPEPTSDLDKIDINAGGISEEHDYTQLPEPKGDGSFNGYKDLIKEVAKKVKVDPYVLATKIANDTDFKLNNGVFDADEWKRLITEFGYYHGMENNPPALNDVKASIIFMAENLKNASDMLRRTLPNRKLGLMELQLADLLGLDNAVKLLKADNAQYGNDVLPELASKHRSLFEGELGVAKNIAEIKQSFAKRVIDLNQKHGIGFEGHESAVHDKPKEGSEGSYGPSKVAAALSRITQGESNRDADAGMNANLGRTPTGASRSSAIGALIAATNTGYTGSTQASATNQSNYSANYVPPVSPGQTGSEHYGSITGSDNDNTVGTRQEKDPRIITLVREPSTKYGTFGKLTIPGKDGRTYDTLELPWRGNEPRVSCIPNGKYTVIYRYKADSKFKACYTVLNVTGRSGILIHAGRYAGDKVTNKDVDSHVQGCILLGNGRATPQTRNDYKQPGVTDTPNAIADFEKRMGRRSFTLVISGGQVTQEEVQIPAQQAIQQPTEVKEGAPEPIGDPNAPELPLVTNPEGKPVDYQPNPNISQIPSPSQYPTPARPSDVLTGINPRQAFDVADRRPIDDLEARYRDEVLIVQKKQLEQQEKINDVLERIFTAVKQVPEKHTTPSGDKSIPMTSSPGDKPLTQPQSQARRGLTPPTPSTVGAGAVPMRRGYI